MRGAGGRSPAPKPKIPASRATGSPQGWKVRQPGEGIAEGAQMPRRCEPAGTMSGTRDQSLGPNQKIPTSGVIGNPRGRTVRQPGTGVAKGAQMSSGRKSVRHDEQDGGSKPRREKEDACIMSGRKPARVEGPATWRGNRRRCLGASGREPVRHDERTRGRSLVRNRRFPHQE